MMSSNLKALSVLALVLSPALALARPIPTSTGHQQAQMIYTHASRPHVDHGSVAHH